MGESKKLWRGSVSACCSGGFHLSYGPATLHVATEDLEGLVMDLCRLLQSKSESSERKQSKQTVKDGERLH